MTDFTKKDIAINVALAGGLGYGLFWFYNESEFSWFCQDVYKLVSTMIDFLENAGAAAKKDFSTSYKDLHEAINGQNLSLGDRTKLLLEAFWHATGAKILYDTLTLKKDKTT